MLQAQTGFVSRAGDDVGGGALGDGGSAFAHEHPPGIRALLRPQAAERAEFVALDGVGGRLAALLAPDVHGAEVDGLPFQQHR